MSTYFTDDFADFATDWTERWDTGGTWSVTSGDLNVASGQVNDWRGLSWNDIDGDANRANVELLVKLTTPSSLGTAIYALFVRGSGADEAATNYSIRLSSAAFRTYYCAGSDSPTQVATTGVSLSGSTVYWIRFRVNGTTIQARIWADGGGEPGFWDLDSTNSNVTAAGWVGNSQYNAPPSGWPVQQFGVGTNGDTAPSSAGSTPTSLALARAFPRPILNF